jgi:hypothetical protein
MAQKKKITGSGIVGHYFRVQLLVDGTRVRKPYFMNTVAGSNTNIQQVKRKFYWLSNGMVKPLERQHSVAYL